MYDTFEPYQEFEPIEFNFQANNYEIWKNAQLIDKGQRNIMFISQNKVIQNINRTIVVINDTLNGIIKQGNVFDKAISSNDRIVLLTLPANNGNDKIQMLSQIYGATRPAYLLDNNEAYSCSVFFKNNNVAKLSFNFYGGHLLEVY
ncbi:MAG: hypothetical protein R2797_12050 [Gelidibacter sp.]